MSERVLLIIICLLGIIFINAIGIHGLIKNYKVTHNSAYEIIEGIGWFGYSAGRGSYPVVLFKYNGEEMERHIDYNDYKKGDKICVYFNPNSNDGILRVVGKVNNVQYIVCMLTSLILWGAIIVLCFPELFI